MWIDLRREKRKLILRCSLPFLIYLNAKMISHLHGALLFFPLSVSLSSSPYFPPSPFSYITLPLQVNIVEYVIVIGFAMTRVIRTNIYYNHTVFTDRMQSLQQLESYPQNIVQSLIDTSLKQSSLALKASQLGHLHETEAKTGSQNIKFQSEEKKNSNLVSFQSEKLQLDHNRW